MGFHFNLLIPIVAIILGCGIPIVAIISDHLTKKAKMRVMEKAIENGIALEGLSLEEKKGPRMPYRGGMVAVALGLGFIIAGVLFGNVHDPMLSAGAIVGLVGIALIINDKINYDRYFHKEVGQQKTAGMN